MCSDGRSSSWNASAATSTRWKSPAGVTDETAVRMCQSLVEQLAAIHSVDLKQTGLDALDDGSDHLDRELNHWAGEMDRVKRDSLPALERLLAALRQSKPKPCSRVTLVHGDAKPGNFAFVGGEVSAVFDWEMTTVGDPLTDIGWLELLWMQSVGITSHPAALPVDALLAHYQAVSGIEVAEPFVVPRTQRLQDGRHLLHRRHAHRRRS